MATWQVEFHCLGHMLWPQSLGSQDVAAMGMRIPAYQRKSSAYKFMHVYISVRRHEIPSGPNWPSIEFPAALFDASAVL